MDKRFKKNMKKYNFNKVIVWGYPLGGHTHSYVHDAFSRAFKSLGYDTIHVNDLEMYHDALKNEANCLYITSSGADSWIPIRKDCVYITHNCGPLKYMDVNNLRLQVAIDSTANLNEIEKVSDCSYYEKNNHTIHMPWATNLLPDEFDFDAVNVPKENNIYWVGTIDSTSRFENIKNIEQFRKACNENNISFIHAWPFLGRPATMDENIDMIRKSYIAPTIVGTWQAQTGFMPCRIFKNTSYGALPATNSLAISKLFGDMCVFNSDPYQLFYDAEKERDNKDKIIKAMKYVQDKHTYINRINDILEVL